MSYVTQSVLLTSTCTLSFLIIVSRSESGIARATLTKSFCHWGVVEEWRSATVWENRCCYQKTCTAIYWLLPCDFVGIHGCFFHWHNIEWSVSQGTNDALELVFELSEAVWLAERLRLCPLASAARIQFLALASEMVCSNYVGKAGFV